MTLPYFRSLPNKLHPISHKGGFPMNKQKKPFQYLLEDILDKALLESLLLSVVFTLFDFFGGRLYFPILSKQVFGVFVKNFVLFFVLAVLFDLITHAASSKKPSFSNSGIIKSPEPSPFLSYSESLFWLADYSSVGMPE